jgi:hypothetical protein
MIRISLYFFLVIYLLPISCLGQTPFNFDLIKTCNFGNLSDSSIKHDLSYFTKKGLKSNLNPKVNFPLTIVDQIKCTDSLIVFENSNLLSMKLHVSIYASKFDTIGHSFKYNSNLLTLIDDRPFLGTKGKIPKTKISRMDVYFSEHKPNAINGYYFNDLYEPRLCKVTNVKNENNLMTCKVFTSKDRRLTYVYIMLGDNNEEVTFVFKNTQYLMRVIDDIEK